MAERELIQIINDQINADFPENISMEELQEKLRTLINDLIQNDFQKLITILYRVDVNENKLKSILKEEVGRDAADIISNLIIERQVQKINTRNQYRDRK
jgi:hypothetical protein